MDNSEIELVGGPCGHHGPYTFYKAFKYSKHGSRRIISLCEFFFVKLWSDSDLVCIGELQLLWVDKNSEQMLASLRLYFLPENTPEGRLDHGEDEVLAISEKVVLRLEDLLTWITVDTEWTWGRTAICEREMKANEAETESAEKTTRLTDSTLDFADVDKERKLLDEYDSKGQGVVVLSYPRYCRFRAVMKRLEGVEDKWLKNSIVAALGGFAVPFQNTRVLFCKDTFDYPDLEGHELLCNHLAPKLKGRPRGKRKKRSISPGGSESNESESSISAVTSANIKTRLTTAGGRNGLRCNSTTSPRRSSRSAEYGEERAFLTKLHAFMKSHRTPIGRIPSIGYKEIDLYAFYTKVQKLGGYDTVTANRMWKPIFDELGGNHNSTSAATIMRRHYERLLLPFERNIKGEEYKPLPVSERRRLKSKTSSFSDAETSEGDRSSSGNTTPVPVPVSVPLPVPSQAHPQPGPTMHTHSPCTPTDIREYSIPEKMKSEGKISSLRSVRVKPERLRDVSQKDKQLAVPATEISSIIVVNTSSLPEKYTSNVPVTSAVAPVVEKTVPEKSAFPLEGKENIPVTNMTETRISQSRTEDDDEPIEIPYNPKSPEIIDLVADSEHNSILMGSNSMIYDVKKRKLDILKEGGLEVTAIPNMPDGRPSVIQQSLGPRTSEIGNLSITVTSDSHRMPPPIPSPRSQSSKKSITSHSYSIRQVQGTDVPRRAATVNGQSPPKVVQSRSIYTYSERTVYGNPKDPFMPPPLTAQMPRHCVLSPAKPAPTPGEVLDLTMKSSQKPIVEIMRVPNVSVKEQSVKNLIKNSVPGVPMIDGRVGSNLEITLVTGSKNTPKVSQPVHRVSHILNNQRPPQKRSSSGKFVSNKPTETRMDNSRISDYNGQFVAQSHGNKSSSGLVIPRPHGGHNRNDTSKVDAGPGGFLSPLFPGYLPQLPAGVGKSFLPVLDPLYYLSMYAPPPAPPPPPLFSSASAASAASVDPLQLYKDIMARSARLSRYPVPAPPHSDNPALNK